MITFTNWKIVMRILISSWRGLRMRMTWWCELRGPDHQQFQCYYGTAPSTWKAILVIYSIMVIPCQTINLMCILIKIHYAGFVVMEFMCWTGHSLIRSWYIRSSNSNNNNHQKIDHSELHTISESVILLSCQWTTKFLIKFYTFFNVQPVWRWC